MKKKIALILSGCLLFTSGVFAAGPVKQKIDVLFGNANISVNGKTASLKASGKSVAPIVYNNLTYMPITPDFSKTTGIDMAVKNGVITMNNPFLSSTAKVKFNDNDVAITDNNGNSLTPIVYNGEMYVPLSALSKAVDRPVQYDRKEDVIYVGRRQATQTPDKWLLDVPLLYSDKSDELNFNKGSFLFNDGTKTANHAIGVKGNSYISWTNTHVKVSANMAFVLNGQYKQLKGKLGVSDLTKNIYSASTVTILGDGEVIYSTGETPVSNQNVPKDITVDISKVNKLEISVSIAGFDLNNDVELLLGDLALYE